MNEENTPATDASSESSSDTAAVGNADGNTKPIRKTTVANEFKKLGIYVLIFYLVGGVIIKFSPLYELLLLRPQGKTDLYNSKIDGKEEITFSNKNGDQIHGWFFRSPRSKRLVLINHGNAGNIIHRMLIVRDFLQLGCSVFVYDYRGYGASTGKLSAAGLVEDSEAAYDYATSKLGFEPEHIILYGESIGTAVTCRLAQERKYEALILQSSLSSLPEVAGDGVIWLRTYPEWVYPDPHYNTARIIAGLKGPFLFIHGMKDKTVPYQHSEKLLALAAEPKTLVPLPNASHNDVQDQDEPIYFAGIKKFLADLDAK